jgi:hypothetical protein
MRVTDHDTNQARDSELLPNEYVEVVEDGPPLTDAERRQGHDNLARWLPPQEFSQITESLCARCQSPEWFNNPHLKYLHDAYVLAHFAQAHAFDLVRLAGPSEQWPDGYAKLGARVHNVEITSTHGGRKLGVEYREVDETPKFDNVKDWVARGESIPRFLEEAISAKRKKRYSSPCWLVVYLNISELGIRQKETEQAIAAVKDRYAQFFEAITVRWKGKSY